jgi:hypothetical protein
MFLAQTLTITAFTILVERVATDLSTVLVAVFGAGFLGITIGVFTWREHVRKRGTAVAIIVRREWKNWEAAKNAAARFQDRERFKYWYPLVDSRQPSLPAVGDSSQVANWSSHFESCRGMLNVIFDSAHGAPVDLSRIALMLNTPLPLAFRLGAEWPDVIEGVESFELVQLRFPDRDYSKDPKVVWKSSPNPGKPLPIAQGPITIAVRTVARFNAQWIEELGDCRVIGEPIDFDVDSQVAIDQLLDEVRREVCVHDHVRLLFATTSPVAFAVGYWLSDIKDRIEVLERVPGGGYVPVSFASATDDVAPSDGTPG